MSDNNPPESDRDPRIDELLAPYFAKYHRDRRYPALIFEYGKRTVLQINVPSRDLPNLLQAKPVSANNPASGKHRREIKGHADDIKQYICKRLKKNKKWILGSFTANVAPEMITVEELGRGFCIVVIPQIVKLDLTDGQHRLKAIRDLMKTDASLLKNESFPITLILEDDFKQCQLDFRDLAQAKPIEKSLSLSFSEYSGRDGIANKLIEEVTMFRGKTNRLDKSPRKKDKLIYTTNYIARAVSCAFVDNPEDELENFEENEQIEKMFNSLANSFNVFFSKCNHTRHICDTSIEKLTVEEVTKFKEECLLGVSLGLEILGRLLYCTFEQKSNSFNSEKILLLAQLDWSRANSLWHNNVVRKETENGKATLPLSWGASAIADAVESAKNQLRW
jgi:DNA sulfur modification protein DndB